MQTSSTYSAATMHQRMERLSGEVVNARTYWRYRIPALKVHNQNILKLVDSLVGKYTLPSYAPKGTLDPRLSRETAYEVHPAECGLNPGIFGYH
jgi:hypothetical protein